MSTSDHVARIRIELSRGGPREAEVIRQALRAAEPPPDLRVSEWACQEFHVVEGPERGLVRLSRTPYLIEPLDNYNDPECHTTAVLKSSQVGITMCGLITTFYIAANDPKDMIAVFPTGKGGEAEKWSKTRFSRHLRDCRPARRAFYRQQSRTSNATIMLKGFMGGNLILAGANAPGALASNPCPVVIIEEVARVASNSGNEGDAQGIVEARQSLFPDRYTLKGGSPTVRGICPSEREFELGDQRYYFVPCPHCDEHQRIMWSQVKWEKDADGNHMPETAYYECLHCGAPWDDAARVRTLDRGEWRATAESSGFRSYHIWQGYSPFIRLAEIVTKFLKAKRGGPVTMQPFVNTVLGETWEEVGDAIEVSSVAERTESYNAREELPKGVSVVTAGIDVQDDRFEVEIVGWGMERESWSLEYLVIPGDMENPSTWARLHSILVGRRYNHPTGRKMKIAGACLDTGGHHTQAAYNYIARTYDLNIWGIKGSSVRNRPIITGPNAIKAEKGFKVKLFQVGSDTAKDVVYASISVDRPGPNYCHFPELHPVEYFSRLVAERKRTRYRQGRPYREYFLPAGRRNEALDCRVYALAALVNLRVDLDSLAEALGNKKRPDREIVGASEVSSGQLKESGADRFGPPAPEVEMPRSPSSYQRPRARRRRRTARRR